MAFLVLMVIGLTGLAMTALPALLQHGAYSDNGQLPAHPPAQPHAHLPPPAAPIAGAGRVGVDENVVPALLLARRGLARWLPSPRGVFTALALYGAFGNLLLDAFHLSALVSALAAAVPAYLVDRFAVRPLWSLAFRYQAAPSAPLDLLVSSEAVATTPFRNGRGIVSANLEGRILQLHASLAAGEASQAVRVGDRLRIEDVDARRERVTVSILR
ncbi:MAG TPA: hypothetical protein VGI39_31035 [Polyangiaceae bacterium]|jgi:hypothetical protein